MRDGTDELTRELGELAGTAAPASGVDVGRAVREGRVRVRRRRFAALGAVAAAVAATAVVSFLPPGVDRAERPTPAASRVWTAPTPAPDTGHALLTVEASFGWLPKNIDALGYLPEKGKTVVRAQGKVPEGGSVAPILWLKVYPEGTTPSTGRPFYPGGPRQHRVEAPSVNGRPAYWVGKSATAAWGPAGGWTLRWQTADGRWAELSAEYMAGTGAQEILHRIAEGVVVAHRAIPLPFRISDVPAGLTLSSAYFQEDPTPWARHVPWTTTISFLVGGRYITTTVQPDLPEPAKSSPPVGSQHVPPKPTCVRERGLKLCTESMYGVDAYRTVGGPKAWLKRFTLLGTDQHDWTTNVLG
ncbi:hypothetical protein PV341_38660 [Streptomyces sp. PA03-1a]|nr:hypothetical protein [Streptomyces sp. PA03-1a]